MIHKENEYNGLHKSCALLPMAPWEAPLVPTQPNSNRNTCGSWAPLVHIPLIFSRIEDLFSKLDVLTRFSAPLLLTGHIPNTPD
jgi:hypothetical protein